MLINLCDIVNEVLVVVAGRGEAGLLQVPKVPEDLPLFLLQRQLTVLQNCRATLQTLRSLGVLGGPALQHLGVLQFLQECRDGNAFYVPRLLSNWVRTGKWFLILKRGKTKKRS